MTLLKAAIGGLAIAVFFYALVLAVHLLEQIYPCRATDPGTGVSRAVSCVNEQPGEAP